MKHQPIQLLRINHLRGPSIWTYHQAVEVLIDIGALEDCPSHTLPGFTDRLLAWLPVVGDPLCLVAGWLKFPPLACACYMAIGKFLRYLVMTAALMWVFPS